MMWNYGNVLLGVANLLIPVAVLIFATGFFPYKPFVPGLAEYHKLEHGEPPAARFNKIVFMVVDALRSDFVYADGSGFNFTQSLIRSGEALPFTAHATSPTITMPRVKAITTGSIPSFLDVILNFAESDTTSSLANQDTWLAQIKNKQDGRLVMYGDDTWLKLFPNTFERSDGTSSFFVSDFTEVDNNVTRHVPHELRADDWDAMIMHYLGLDHIGHKAGPLSPNMVPKQREMDGIVQQIYDAMTAFDHLNSTLLVLCGDHGMNEGGNHGGSAPGETSPALVFISPNLKTISRGNPSPTLPRQDFDFYDKIEQSDIAPTLAGLLGFPVPLNNLGVFIRDFLPLWDESSDQVQLLLRNALQILDIVKATFPGENFDDHKYQVDCEEPQSPGIELACLWHNVQRELRVDDTSKSQTDFTVQALFNFCRRAQDVMSSTASNYDVPRLFSGIAVATTALILAVIASWNLKLSWQLDGGFYFLIVTLYGIMMFASSYVEEEQHFWYWVTGGWIFYQSIRKAQQALLASSGSSRERETAPEFLLLFTLHRITQRWNQTGQKFAGAPDIVHNIWMRYPVFLWFLVGVTYLLVLIRVGNHVSIFLKAGATVGSACAIMLCVPAFIFKLGFTASDAPELLSWLGGSTVASLQHVPLVGSARIIFFLIGSEVIWAYASRFASKVERIAKRDLITILHTLLTLFLITQTRATNIPLFFLFQIQEFILSTLNLTETQTTITTLLLGYTAFFAFGNSNAISSIDLSNAYNGVSGFNVLAVGILLFAGNWAGPIYWSVTGIKLIVHQHSSSKHPEKSTKAKRKWVEAEMDHLLPSKPEKAPPKGDSPFYNHVALLTIFTTVSLVAVMVACTALRTHLFIWTVFSPKYLYIMAWSLGFHLIVYVGLGGTLWAICGGEDN